MNDNQSASYIAVTNKFDGGVAILPFAYCRLESHPSLPGSNKPATYELIYQVPGDAIQVYSINESQFNAFLNVGLLFNSILDMRGSGK